MTVWKHIFISGVLLATCGLCLMATEPKPLPALAVFGRTGLPIDDHLRSIGWQTCGLSWGADYDIESLRRFNVIVIGTYPKVVKGTPRNNWQFITPEYDQQMRTLLREFVENGGGLLIYAAQHPTSHVRSVNRLLSTWNAEFLEETVLDTEHTFTQRGGMGWTWNITDNIAEHPATHAVKTLFYPLRDIYVPANWPLRTDSTWQVLVCGMDTAQSHPAVERQHLIDADLDRIGTYDANPPLAAVRKAGQGRIAAFAWSPTPTFFNLDHFMVGNIYFNAGSGDVPSDGLRFLEQTLTYLAEPAIKAGYGGYRNEPNRPKLAIDAPLDWSKQTMGNDGGVWGKGIIGARTEWTGGSGSVDEYVTAATNAGLDFIAFMEDFTQLDPERWDAFRKACREATTPDLLVLPGVAAPRGEADTEFFIVSDFPWPPRAMLSADGNSFDNHLHAHFRMGLNTHGPFNLQNQSTPPWVSRAYNSMAVVTTINGKSTLDLDAYLYNVGIQDAPKPIAVDRIDSPAQVADATNRFLNLRLSHSQDDLRHTLKNPDAGRSAQISNGPIITTFQGRNRYPQTNGRYIPGRERFMIRIAGQSDVPLRELTLYQGTEVFRRYALDASHCDINVHGLHDRQYQLTAVLTDIEGHMAVRGPLELADNFNRRTICSDRQNSIGGSRQADTNGNQIIITSSLNQMKYSVSGTIGGVPDTASTVPWVPWYWDGSRGPIFSGHIQNEMTGLNLPEPTNSWRLIHRMAFPLGSRDVIVQGIHTEALCDTPVHSQAYYPVIPMPRYQVETRMYEFKKTPDAPSSMLIEGVYTMTEDGQWPEGGWLYQNRLSHAFYKLYGRPDENARWVWHHPDEAEITDQPFPEKNNAFNAYRELHPEGYVAFQGPHSTLALFALDKPLGGWFSLHRENWLRGWIGLSHNGESYHAGDRLPYRMVVFSGSVTAPVNRDEIEQFRSAFGLDNTGPAYRVMPRKGTVRSTRYVLELDAEDGGFAGTISLAKLPHRLPVRVHGVNPNWTCGVVDLATREWLPLGVIKNLPLGKALPETYAAYAAIELDRNRDLFIGNVVSCDNPALHLTLLPDGTGGFLIEAHNPGNTPITTSVRTATDFVLVPEFSADVTVQAGHSIILEVD